MTMTSSPVARSLLPRRAGRPWLPGGGVAMAALVAALAFLTLLPIGMLFYGSLHTTQPGLPGALTLDGYRKVFTPANLELLWATVQIAIATTGIAFVGATLLAWIIARTDTPGRRVLEILITFPVFIPPILSSTAWGMLGNPQVGVFNLAWTALTGSETPIVNIYSWWGVVWLISQISTAFLFMFLVDNFRAVDPSLEEASRMAGAGQFQTFFRITGILLLPALTNCFLLSFIRGLESFEPALIYGSQAGIRMLATQVYLSITQEGTPDYQYATALGFALIVLMFVLVSLQWRILRGRSFQTVSGKGFNPRPITLGRWRWLTFALCAVYVMLAVIAPVTQMFIGTFFEYFGYYYLDMLTLQHWREVLYDREFWAVLGNTMLLGLIGASVTMAIGSAVSYTIVRLRTRSARIVEALAWLPYMMPGIVLGVGFLWTFALMPSSVPIYGTIWALIIANVTLSTPLSVRLMSASFAQLAVDLEEASRVAGASWLATQWRITIALAWPSFMVGWILIFFGILRELSAAMLLYSAGSETLSILLFRLWNDGQVEQVSVIGLILLALVVLLRVVQHRFLVRGVKGV
ncbi:MAG: iron ABC transporter permease [Sphingobium sp.]